MSLKCDRLFASASHKPLYFNLIQPNMTYEYCVFNNSCHHSAPSFSVQCFQREQWLVFQLFMTNFFSFFPHIPLRLCEYATCLGLWDYQCLFFGYRWSFSFLIPTVSREISCKIFLLNLNASFCKEAVEWCSFSLHDSHLYYHYLSLCMSTEQWFSNFGTCTTS